MLEHPEAKQDLMGGLTMEELMAQLACAAISVALAGETGIASISSSVMRRRAGAFPPLFLF